jgi:hypothetical protein
MRVFTTDCRRRKIPDGRYDPRVRYISKFHYSNASFANYSGFWVLEYESLRSTHYT